MAAALPLGLYGCSSSDRGDGPLAVGGLPVTCNLTLPVACVGKNRAIESAQSTNAFRFEYSKYSGWPEIKESLMAGRIQAGYMLAPLVMDLADKKIPVKIVSLGHRSGAVIMVKKDSAYEKFADLKGKRVAIPSRFAVDFLFLRKMLTRENMTPRPISRSSKCRRPICRRPSMQTPSTLIARANLSAPPRKARATRACCA
ncbi:MAG: ABC-type nitrate/sulfonate/bicarbonate transport system periplasmic component-like protein [Steroidobacteraceae bacterium]|nr:ABC-type nitrate/sulfonate/bicarbonate transport system periplasmic component-like protein [Steroidobacteraceae bacterium]